MIRVVHPRSESPIPDPDLDFLPGSRGQKGTGSRTADTDPQHCVPVMISPRESWRGAHLWTGEEGGVLRCCGWCGGRGLGEGGRGLQDGEQNLDPTQAVHNVLHVVAEVKRGGYFFSSETLMSCSINNRYCCAKSMTYMHPKREWYSLSYIVLVSRLTPV